MKKYFLSGCLLVCYCCSNSQDSLMMENKPVSGSNKKSNGVDYMIAVTVGGALGETKNAVKNKMGNLGFGLALELLFDPIRRSGKASPIRLGADIAYNYYGRFISNVTINGYSGSYKTTFGIGRLNGIIRFRPAADHRFIPFADVFGGLNLYECDTKENLTAIESSLGTEKVYMGGKSSFGFNKGIGAGFSISTSKEKDTYIKFRVSCNWGTSVKYVVRNSLTYDPIKNKIVYQTGTAGLNYIFVQLGVGL